MQDSAIQDGESHPVAAAALRALHSAGVRLTRGLSEDELAAVETELGFRFAADHRDLLAQSLPAGAGWPDWRRRDDELRRRLGQPVEGLVFDAVHNGFWPASWGVRPSGSTAVTHAVQVAARRLPVLVPLYRHRYVPAAGTAGPSPVFSVHQSDVIYFGRDLADYATREFTGDRSGPVDTDGIGTVPFWSDLAKGTDDSVL